MTVQMEIKGLILDPVSNMPVVVLRDIDARRILPIWVGVFEANAIALRMENVESPRPMTHDLLKSTIEELGFRVDRIVISALRESTYFAQVHLSGVDRSLVLDSRPSDAIALALRAGAPILAEETVLTSAEQTAESPQTEADRVRKLLEDLPIEELGKYRM